MRSLYKDPKGEKVFDNAFAIDSGGGEKATSGRNSMGSHSALNLNEKLKTLSAMNRRASIDQASIQQIQNGVS